MVKKTKYSLLATVGFILSFLFFVPFVPFIGAVLGIFSLGYISKNKNFKGKGLAIAAIIVGLLLFFLQVYFFILLYNFMGMFGAIVNPNIAEATESCISENQGLDKDLCIFFLVSVNANNTEALDQNLCDEHVADSELQSYCNAILKRDSSYCEDIENVDNRLDCYGFVEEFKRKS